MKMLLFLFISILILVILRGFIFKEDIKKEDDFDEDAFDNKIRVGNGQLIGQKEYQNDYFSILYNKDGSLFASIADGISEKKDGKNASLLTIEILKNNFLNKTYENLGIEKFYIESLKEINKRMKDTAQGNKTGSKLISIIIRNGFLHYASVGNCLLLIYRNNELMEINDIKTGEMEINKIKIIKGDIAILCSKGIYKSLMEMEIICEITEGNHPYKKCQNLIRQIQQKHLKNQDNGTLIIVEEMI